LIASGETGKIGSTAVLVGLALGAKRVIALGREGIALNKLQEIDPKRVVTVRLQGDFESDKHAVVAVARGADLVYDMLGSAPTFAPTAAAIYGLHRGRTAMLMGGVQAAIDLPYSSGMLNELCIKGL
jgi:alcohol dehydrogenase